MEFFLNVFFNDLGSRRFCCSIFGDQQKSLEVLWAFFLQAVLAQKFQGPHLGNFQGFSRRCALERAKSWENPSWFRVKKGSQNAAKTSRWWNGCFFWKGEFHTELVGFQPLWKTLLSSLLCTVAVYHICIITYTYIYEVYLEMDPCRVQILGKTSNT